MNNFDVLQTLLACDRREKFRIITKPGLDAVLKAAHRTLASIMVIGGINIGERASMRRFSYDIHNDQWTELDPFTDLSEYILDNFPRNTSRARTYISPLLDGTVIMAITGRYKSEDRTLIFDPHGGFRSLSVSKHPYLCRDHVSMVTLNDGNVLSLGGVALGYDHGVNEVENAMYHTSTDSCRALDFKGVNIPTAAGVAVMADGNVFICGGWYGRSSAVSAACMIYYPDTGLFKNVSSMNSARKEHSACLLHDGRVFVYGGLVSTDRLIIPSTVDIYDPLTDKWTETAVKPVSPGYARELRIEHMCVQLPNGEVFISGGVMSQRSMLYNLDTMTIRETAFLDTNPTHEGRTVYAYVTIPVYQ